MINVCRTRLSITVDLVSAAAYYVYLYIRNLIFLLDFRTRLRSHVYQLGVND